MNLYKYLVIAVLMSGCFAIAKETKMTGVQVVCTAGNDYLAFNLNSSRIWLTRGQFQNNTVAAELENVQIVNQAIRAAGTSYKGDLIMNFGSTKAVLKMMGVLFLSKVPMTGTLTVCEESCRSKPVQLSCKAI